MRIAYTTTFAAKDVHNWSGTPHHMAHHFSQQGCSVDYIGPLTRKLPLFFKTKQIFSKYILSQRESPRFHIYAAQQYSQQLATALRDKQVDAIVSPLVNPIAYLESNRPLILWTDAVYASLIGFYPPFNSHSKRTRQHGNEITRACLTRCNLTIFSSEWAANAAIELYGVDPAKVKVIPFGANIEHYPTHSEIIKMVAKRQQPKIKLLFLAKSWDRKGGDTVLAVAKALYEANHPVELTIVGIQPPRLTQIPPYVRCLGFISKHNEAGKQRFNQLLAESHFLFVPSIAEAYGIVFCEANAFAIPCITTNVGGIGTIIKDHVNGMKFALNTPIAAYCDYIKTIMADWQQYQQLALSAYEQFVTRLNWQVAIQQAKQYIQALL